MNRVKEIKGITSKETFEVILKQLVPAEKVDTINRIIGGLSQEDEFALLCFALLCFALLCFALLYKNAGLLQLHHFTQSNTNRK